MISAIISRLVILLFGTLYPAYASYKAVRTKNVKEYVKWMMYWIVFALFTCAETFTDVFLSFWFPFYYEIKVVLVIYLLSPVTKGSSFLYRNFVHPALIKREQEIDEYITKTKEQGYHTMLHLSSKGITYATSVIMQTAIKGGGGIVNHLRRSYSLSDLSSDAELKSDLNRNSKLQGDAVDSADVPRDSRMRTQRNKPGGSHVDLYFPEMDVDIRSHSHHPELPVSLSQIRSTEDISSGYSSAEPLYGEAGAMVEGNPLMRTASVGATRARTARGRATTQPKKALTTEEEEDESTAGLGWQHPLPPLPIASFFPGFFNSSPSGLPPQAFISPEALQFIYTNSLYGGQEPQNILYEIHQEEEVKMPEEVGILKVDEVFEYAEQQKLEDAEQQKLEDAEEQKLEDAEQQKLLDVNVITEPSMDISNEKDERIYEVKPPSPESSLPNVTDAKNNVTEIPVESIVTSIPDSEVSPTKQVITEAIAEKEYAMNSKEDIEQPSEIFEDATEGEVLFEPILDGKVLITPTTENETGEESLKPTASLESVASSDDQGFEDSLPDVAIVVADRESPSVTERKGKYNKGRAPPPPDLMKNEEVEIKEVEQSVKSAKPDLLLGSTAQSQVLRSELLNKPESSNTTNEHNFEGRQGENVGSVFERDVSPSPSQSKKDSNLSRFLPKAGSLFNFWGYKDDSPGVNKSNLSGSSSNASMKSSTSSAFCRPSSPSSNFASTVQYGSESLDVSRNEKAGRTTPKIKIRQMSQSPSRRRQHFE